MSFIRYTAIVILLAGLTEGLASIDHQAPAYITAVILIGALAWDIKDHFHRFIRLCIRTFDDKVEGHYLLKAALVAFGSILSLAWMAIYWITFLVFGFASIKWGGAVTAMFIVYMAWQFNPNHINRFVFVE